MSHVNQEIKAAAPSLVERAQYELSEAERGVLSDGVFGGVVFVTLGSDFFKLDTALLPNIKFLSSDLQLAACGAYMLTSLARGVGAVGMTTQRNMKKREIQSMLSDSYRGYYFSQRWADFYLAALSKMKGSNNEAVNQGSQLIFLLDAFRRMGKEKRQYYTASIAAELEKRFPDFKITSNNSIELSITELMASDIEPDVDYSFARKDSKDVQFTFSDVNTLDAKSAIGMGMHADKWQKYAYFYKSLQADLKGVHEYASSVFRQHHDGELDATLFRDAEYFELAKRKLAKTNNVTSDIEQVKLEALSTIKTSRAWLEDKNAVRKDWAYVSLRNATYQYYLCLAHLQYAEHTNFVLTQLEASLEKSQAQLGNLRKAGFNAKLILQLLELRQAQYAAGLRANHTGRYEWLFGSVLADIIGYLGFLPVMIAYGVLSGLRLSAFILSLFDSMLNIGLRAIAIFVFASILLTLAVYQKNKAAGVLLGAFLAVCTICIAALFITGSPYVAIAFTALLTTIITVIYTYQFFRFFKTGLSGRLAQLGESIDHYGQQDNKGVSFSERLPACLVMFVISFCSLAGCPFLLQVVIDFLALIGVGAASATPVGLVVIGLMALGQLAFSLSLIDKFILAFKTDLGTRSALYKECVAKDKVWAYWVGFAIYVCLLIFIVSLAMMADKLGFNGLSVTGGYLNSLMAVSFISNFTRNAPDISINLLRPLVMLAIRLGSYISSGFSMLFNGVAFVFMGLRNASFDNAKPAVNEAQASAAKSAQVAHGTFFHSPRQETLSANDHFRNHFKENVVPKLKLKKGSDAVQEILAPGASSVKDASGLSL